MHDFTSDSSSDTRPPGESSLSEESLSWSERDLLGNCDGFSISRRESKAGGLAELEGDLG